MKNQKVMGSYCNKSSNDLVTNNCENNVYSYEPLEHNADRFKDILNRRIMLRILSIITPALL